MRRRQALSKNPEQFARISRPLANSDLMQLARKAFGPETDPEDMNDEFLLDLYVELYGRMPHGRMKRETMLQRIYEAQTMAVVQ